MAYNIDTSKATVPEALEVLADAVLNPKFQSWEVAEQVGGSCLKRGGLAEGWRAAGGMQVEASRQDVHTNATPLLATFLGTTSCVDHLCHASPPPISPAALLLLP